MTDETRTGAYGAPHASAPRAVILDRDGTLIDFHRDTDLGVVTPAFHPDQLRLLPGVVEGLALLHAAGCLLAIATNQPDAARGRVPRTAIERTNDALIARLAAEGIPISRFEVCLHHPEGGPGGDAALVRPCDCRKPAPGMLQRILSALGIETSDAWMVGDGAADLGAARAAGLRFALVAQPERCEICPLRGAPPTGALPHLVAPRLDSIARVLLGSEPAPGGPHS
jgi:D-glycero-D-manno-heptose 1,7-bisphosphate phosphatase